MSGLTSHKSIFHKVATKEDDYTQLLCNFMRRSDSLRAAVLSLFLDDKILAAKVEYGHISTQAVIKGAGRPDLVIESPQLRATIEVKLNPHRRCEDSQLPPDDETLKGYSSFLDGESAATKLLLFLIPRDWKYREETDKKLKEFERRKPSIKTKIVTWEGIFAL